MNSNERLLIIAIPLYTLDEHRNASTSSTQGAQPRAVRSCLRHCPRRARRARQAARFPIRCSELVLQGMSTCKLCPCFAYQRQNLDYNVPGGKLIRGLNVLETVEALNNRPLSSTEYFQAAVLGWAVELVSILGIISKSRLIVALSTARSSIPRV